MNNVLQFTFLFTILNNGLLYTITPEFWIENLFGKTSAL